MYLEKMNQLRKLELEYRHKIDEIYKTAHEFREEYFIERIGESRYKTITNTFKLMSESREHFRDTSENRSALDNLLQKCFRNVRSSSTPTGIYHLNREIRLYPSGIGYEYYGRTREFDKSQYLDIIKEHGSDLEKFIWKGNKREMLKTINKHIDKWTKLPKDTIKIKTDMKLKIPTSNDLIEFNDEKIEKITIHCYNSYYPLVKLSRGWYNKVWDIDVDYKAEDMFIFNQIYTKVISELDMKALRNLEKYNIKNYNVYNELYKELIPYLSLEIY